MATGALPLGNILSAAPSSSGAAGLANKANNVWLNAWHDPVANIKAFSAQMELSDLYGDGDYKLIIADLSKKLKVYKGTSLISEHVLLDPPVALISYYMDAATPAIPAVAVASGPHIYIYKQLRPSAKFTTPPLHVDPLESEIWNDLQIDKIDGSKARDMLKAAKDKGTPLTSRSLDLLSLQDTSKMNEYIASHRGQPLLVQTAITCLTCIKKSRDDENAISCLVFGTEAAQVMILDPTATTVLKKLVLRSAPSFIVASGLYDVDFRLIIACRNASIYIAKNDELTGVTIELESQAVSLVRIDKLIFVGCMGQVVHSYQVRGKKAFSLYMPAPIIAMEALHHTVTNSKALLVALITGELRLYHEKHLVSVVQLDPSSNLAVQPGLPALPAFSTFVHPSLEDAYPSVVSGMRFGHFGRETGALILTFSGGALQCKILSRTSSNIAQLPPLAGLLPEQDIPLKVPKKTKLYIEQTLREHENAIEMHRVFQRELYKLRLQTARSFAKIISDSQGPLSFTAGASLRLTAQVQGIGPVFKLKIQMENTGKRPLQDLVITFIYSHELYRIPAPVMQVPVLVPELSYKLEAVVECKQPETGGAEAIRAIVSQSGSVLPLVAAIITMPIPEVLFQT